MKRTEAGSVPTLRALQAYCAVISVCDDGPGIPAGEHQYVFLRFYRLERSRCSPGNGLGLSLVAAVAHLH
jgi:signal transduction histidine kinase